MPTPESAAKRFPFPIAAIVNVLGVLLALAGGTGFVVLAFWVHPWLGVGLLSAGTLAAGVRLMIFDVQEHS